MKDTAWNCDVFMDFVYVCYWLLLRKNQTIPYPDDQVLVAKSEDVLQQAANEFKKLQNRKT
jgi:hypothetical protein